MTFKTLIAAGLVLAAGSAAQADVKFGVMNEPYLPFFAKDPSGTWIGWEIELLDAVCAEMKEVCSIVDMSWDGLIPGLQTKKIDVIWSSMSITPERQETIAFTRPYYTTPAKLIGSKEGKTGATPEDVKGTTMGLQVATIQSKYFAKYFAGVASERTYSTLDEAFQDLASGRIDYVFGDAIPLSAFLKTDFGQSCCEDRGDVAADDAILGLGVGGGLRKDETDLKARLDAAIAAVHANGTYAEITARYFDVDIWAE